jgi:opacity protein-like surface antigen
MKKTLFVFVLLVACAQSVFSQYDTVWVNGVPTVNRKKGNDESDSSPLKKDDYLLEVSYGYPFTPVREAAFFGLNIFTNTKGKGTSKNLNHICLRADYQLNTDFSVGLELTYASQTFEYYRTYTSYVSNVPVSHDSLFSAKASKIRFLAKLGYHLNISERFDAYGTAGFGFKQFNYSTNDSYLTTANLINEISPVAIRGSIGGRFFVSENFAIHVEAGIGGPIMQFGLTYKIKR